MMFLMEFFVPWLLRPANAIRNAMKGTSFLGKDGPVFRKKNKASAVKGCHKRQGDYTFTGPLIHAA